MKLFTRIVELLLISSLFFLAAGCPESQSKKAAPIALPAGREMLVKELGFDYSNLRQAEAEIARRIDSAVQSYPAQPYIPHNELIALLSHDPATLDYDFKQLTDSGYLNIAASDDGNLKIYYWNTGMGGTMADWGNVIQFRADGKPYVYCGSILDFSNMAADDAGNNCAVPGIITVKAPGGHVYYLVKTCSNEFSDLEYSSLVPVRIGHDGIEAADILPADPTATDGRNCTWREYNAMPWYTRTDGEGFVWMYRFDTATNTLYVPEVVDSQVTDRYNLYTLEGDRFTYTGDDGGFWLHPSIRKFRNLEAIFATRQFMIRIDRLEDDSFRYASWSDELSMRGQPDIILFNGAYDADSNTFSFANGSFEYRVTPGAPTDELTVYQNGKLILSETRVKR